VSALLTDLYELNMAASYLRRGIDGPATFSLFARKLPPERGFLVSGGVEPALDLLEGFRFEAADLEYLAGVGGFTPADLERFRGIRFTGEVWGIPEGRLAFAGEPLLEVTAPIAEAQLVETLLLNQVSFGTAIASKAARCVIAARGRGLVDFAFRRTQGLEAGLEVARLSALAGFQATSNVEAARRFGLVAAGTMAHSYVEAFASEREAFRAFAHDFPTRTTFLVDTYDTLNGVRTAIGVIRELGLRERAGIRLDSGDLAALARESRRLLDEAGLPWVRIMASGGLDELEVERLVVAGAPVDLFGVGTKMGVSADRPYLDTAYKLVQLGERPVMKLSTGKITAPGRKQVFRSGSPLSDVIGLRAEQPPPGAEPVLVPLMWDGVRVRPRPPLADGTALFKADLARLPVAALRLDRPEAPVPSFSPALAQLAERTGREALRAAGLSALPRAPAGPSLGS
jgi:nicotinate phosphoribosyltransferase